MNLFLADIREGQAELTAEETRHCLRVLRHLPGDRIHVVDGKGLYAQGILLPGAGPQARIQVEQQAAGWGEHPYTLRLAVSPLHHKDRFEWLAEKAVELGVTHIDPLLCGRTDKFQSKYKESRLQSILLSALKQSKRSRLPELGPLRPFGEWLADQQQDAGFMAHCLASRPLSLCRPLAEGAGRLTLLIGPEGDFLPEEIEQAEAAGFQSVSLGVNRLRSETAALFGLSLIKGWLGY